MASHVDRPIVCPTLVGRATYLAALEAQLTLARERRGETILIAGEAGIGKSRLVAEATTRAVAREMRVLIGRCFEPDRVLPYAPLRDLARARGADQADLLLAEESAPSVPDAVRRAPDAARDRQEASPAASLDPERERRRLVDAWTRFVVGLAAERPSLIVIEDAHWADDASLDALLAVARRLADQPLLLVLTYRTTKSARACAICSRSSTASGSRPKSGCGAWRCPRLRRCCGRSSTSRSRSAPNSCGRSTTSPTATRFSSRR